MRNAKCEMRKKMKNAELIEAVKVLFWGWLRVERTNPFCGASHRKENIIQIFIKHEPLTILILNSMF